MLHVFTALKPLGFGPDILINVSMRESARRDMILAAAANSRRRRSTGTPDSSSVMVRFRTTSSNGVLMFASTGGSAYSILSVSIFTLYKTVHVGLCFVQIRLKKGYIKAVG